MHRFAVACLGLGLVLGCGGEQAEPAAPVAGVPPSGATAAAVTPAPTAIASTAPTAAASATPSTPPAGGADGASGGKRAPAHWTDFAGPKIKATALSSKKAWAVVPVGLQGKFDIVKIALEEYGKPAGEEQLLIEFDKSEMYVPAGLVKPTATAKGLAKGDALMVNVAAASGFGRVTKLEKGEADEGERVTFKYAWGGSVSEETLPLDEVVKLEDKVAFGHPVAVKDGDDWVHAQCIYTDATTSWIIAFGGSPRQVATKDLRPLKLAKPLAKGAKVSAYGGAFKFAPGKIVDVLEGGAQYKVKFEAGDKEETLPLERVSAPL